MSSSVTQKIAVVTGANKGIGYAIVKGMCERYQGVVYLTARSETRGKAAVARLEALGLGYKPRFHQLDITDAASIDTFKQHLLTAHGGFDVLINNAAIAFKTDATEPFGVQAAETIRVNYFGVLNTCQALFPLLRRDARVINLSSSAGLLKRIPGAELRRRFVAPQLTVTELSDLMRQFVAAAQAGTAQADGWGGSAYVVSKVGVSALSVLQQRQFDSSGADGRNISVNAVHPGYVDTDMTSHKGVLTVEQGASAPLYLALEEHGLKGRFIWNDSTVVPWDAD